MSELSQILQQLKKNTKAVFSFVYFTSIILLLNSVRYMTLSPSCVILQVLVEKC